MPPITVDHPNVKLLLLELATGPSCVTDISHALGIGLRCAYRAIVAARAAKLIRIATWERARGKPRPVYGLGNKYDAPMPAPFTGAENSQRYRARRTAADLVLRSAR